MWAGQAPAGEHGKVCQLNIQHLRYAIEVEKTESISQAAENLYMGQPNLSKAVRELENSLGITIFKRSSRGVVPTAEGREFLHYARSILAQVDEVEAMYRPGRPDRQSFRVSVPRSSYVAYVFTSFVEELDRSVEAEISFRETDSLRAVKNVATGEDKLGIIRYQTVYEPYFLRFLAERKLKHIEVMEFSYAVMASRESRLAAKEEVTYEDLKGCIEIAHGDENVPYLPAQEKKRQGDEKRIYVYDRGSHFDLLARVPDTFMWCAPMPGDVLQRNGLVLKPYQGKSRSCKDVMIYPEGYRLSRLDRLFVQKMEALGNMLSHAKPVTFGSEDV